MPEIPDLPAAASADINPLDELIVELGGGVAPGTYRASLRAIFHAMLPSGLLIPCAAVVGEPAGWLRCNGQTVSRTTYADLFAAIGTTWGAGDGSSTFTLPDLRGRGVIGHGSGAGLTSRTAGQVGGAETHQLTLAQIPAHSHAPVTSPAFIGTTGVGNLPVGTGALSWSSNATTNAQGGGQSHNNMQPFAVAEWLIKT